MVIKIKNILSNFLRFYVDFYSVFFKKTFCNHDYKFWKMRMIIEDRYLNNREMVKWRKCNKCGKKQELSMKPGDFKWKKTYRDLPDNKNIIDVELKRVGHESKSEKRNRIINSLLK